MKHELTSRRKERRIMAVWTSLVLTTALFTTSAFAADSDPLTIVNNLSDFIFSCIKAIGIIILGWGVVQLGMSVQSHDATQRTQGVLCLFGGLLHSLHHTDSRQNFLCKGNQQTTEQTEDALRSLRRVVGLHGHTELHDTPAYNNRRHIFRSFLRLGSIIYVIEKARFDFLSNRAFS